MLVERNMSGCPCAGCSASAETRLVCAPGARGRGTCLAAHAPGVLRLLRTGREPPGGAPGARGAGHVWLLMRRVFCVC